GAEALGVLPPCLVAVAGDPPYFAGGGGSLLYSHNDGSLLQAGLFSSACLNAIPEVHGGVVFSVAGGWHWGVSLGDELLRVHRPLRVILVDQGTLVVRGVAVRFELVRQWLDVLDLD